MNLRRGGADAHTRSCERHWTVRGFQGDRPKCTFHVYSGKTKAKFFNNGGKGWQPNRRVTRHEHDGKRRKGNNRSNEGHNNGLDIERKCRPLHVAGEEAGQQHLMTTNDDGTERLKNDGNSGQVEQGAVAENLQEEETKATA
jgi:hypothetical protein